MEISRSTHIEISFLMYSRFDWDEMKLKEFGEKKRVEFRNGLLAISHTYPTENIIHFSDSKIHMCFRHKNTLKTSIIGYNRQHGIERLKQGPVAQTIYKSM